jgi:hypothetical protein
LGIDDGFTTYLRGQFDEEDYLDIEIEVNQRWVGNAELKTCTEALSKSLVQVLSANQKNDL